ncbi:MAG: hypothetical protein M1434_02725 [Chloroflexi bacterium]|nr:hypothetical protein [Chloroflexota bacterium]
MKRTTLLLIGCVAAAAIALGAGYVAGGAVIGGAIALLAGGLWLLAVFLGDRPAATTLGWVCFSGAAGFGVVIGLQPGLMLIALVAALCAWDIAYTEQRLNAALRVDQAALLERRHLRALALAAGAGLAVGAAALLIRVEFGFGIAAVLAIAAVVLLGWMARLEL